MTFPIIILNYRGMREEVSLYSQDLLIRTLKGQKICSNWRMFELLKVVIKTLVDHQNGRETQEGAFLYIFKFK